VRFTIEDGKTVLVMPDRRIVLPRLSSGGGNLYLESHTVAQIRLPAEYPFRIETEIALALVFAKLTQSACPGCGRSIQWRGLGYQHLDPGAPDCGPGWIPCDDDNVERNPRYELHSSADA
jgi:hypothetical protein